MLWYKPKAIHLNSALKVTTIGVLQSCGHTESPLLNCWFQMGLFLFPVNLKCHQTKFSRSECEIWKYSVLLFCIQIPDPKLFQFFWHFHGQVKIVSWSCIPGSLLWPVRLVGVGYMIDYMKTAKSILWKNCHWLQVRFAEVSLIIGSAFNMMIHPAVNSFGDASLDRHKQI